MVNIYIIVVDLFSYTVEPDPLNKGQPPNNGHILGTNVMVVGFFLASEQGTISV